MNNNIYTVANYYKQLYHHSCYLPLYSHKNVIYLLFYLIFCNFYFDAIMF